MRAMSHEYHSTDLILLATHLFVQKLIQINSKEAIKVLNAEDPLVTSGFPAQMANNMECVSMS